MPVLYPRAAILGNVEVYGAIDAHAFEQATDWRSR